MLASWIFLIAIGHRGERPTPGADLADEPGRPAASGAVIDKLRAEADRLRAGHTSAFFRAVATGDASSLKLSPAQVEQVRTVDQVCRDVQRAWLLRGLDNTPTPPERELIERTSDRGSRLRESLVAHAEALALGGALDPEQAAAWLKKVDRPATPQLAGRYPVLRVPTDEPAPDNKGSFDWAVRSEMKRLKVPVVAASELFHVLRDQSVSRLIGLSNEQARLILALDEVDKDAQHSWLGRGLDEPNPIPNERRFDPPPAALVERVSDRGIRVRNSLIAHAEAIVMDGILDQDQATGVKRRLWARMGYNALLDPEVATTLMLTKAQRQALAPRLENLAAVRHEVRAVVFGEGDQLDDARRNGEITEGQLASEKLDLREEAKSEVGQATIQVTAVLTKAQAREFQRLLKDTATTAKDSQPGLSGGSK